MLFFISNSHANIIRPTTFDDRPQCEQSKGMWRDFGNSCADKCEYKFQKYPYCSTAIIYSCDCGKNRCLYQDKCIDIIEYKSVYEQNEAEENKLLEEVKEERLKKSKKFKKEYMNKFVNMFNHDPNYRDPYYYQREKPLPPNTFKSNNRMLIYNNLVKQQNDKIANQKRILQERLEELNKTNVSNKNKQNKINKIKEELAKIESVKVLQPITEKNDDTKNQIIESVDEKLPVVDDISSSIKEPLEKIIDNSNENNSVISETDFIKKINNFLEKKNENSPLETKDNKSVENNSLNNQDNKIKTKIPQIYIKSQNGDADFQNQDIIDNSTNFPQFTN